MEQNMFIRILNSEMELATGCTEPGAVALTAAEAGQALRKAGVDKAEEITVNASINIIKNAMSAGIPGTDYEGMDYAAAIGALGGDPVYLLEVMNHVPRETVEAAAALVKAGKVKVNVAQVPQKLYIEVIAKGGGHTGRAIVRDLHTNVVLVEQDGAATLDKRDTDTAAAGDSDVVTPEQIASFLTVRSIWDYCTKELDPMNDPIDIIRSAVKVNSVISDEGLSKEYGLAIGRNLDLNCRKGLMTRDLTTNSMIAAAAGADARMAGAPVSVVANSGSGNQGITATMPVVAAARWLDIDEPTMLRAVTLSNLIAIRIKSKFGRLSNLCGATVAGTGAACGITYLLGGGYHEICCAIQNMVGNVTGMVCDGAKADCGNIVDIFGDGNTILVTDPAYPVYVDSNTMCGRNIIYADSNEENGFAAMPDENVHADIIYLCSPNNPTGSVYTKEQLKIWVDYALKNEAIIIFDSAYEAFISDPALPRSIFCVEGAKKCAIEMCSLSKTAGFTGTRCGYTVIPEELIVKASDGSDVSIAQLWGRRQGSKFNGVSYPVQCGAAAVFTPEGQKQTHEAIDYYRRNAKLMADTLTELGIKFTGGINSPYIWLKCPNNMGSWEFFDYLLEKIQVVGTPGEGFGKNGAGWFRLTAFGTYENTQEAMNRFKELLK